MRTLSLASILRVAASALLPALITLGSVSALAQASAPAASASAPATVNVPVLTPVPMASEPAKKSADAIDNPYGIEALWKGSDTIARSVLVLLGIMSVGSWYILVVKLLEQSKMTRHARTVDKQFWSAPTVGKGASSLEKNSAYRFIAESGVQATTDHGGLKSHIPMNDWIPMSITGAVDRVHATTQGGLAFLATVGSTSPFVGLFGTVWGIYHALTAIGISGQASIDKVAGPVGEALIMTAIGLAVAIPAVLAYNWLARRNKAVMDQVREFADELNAVIVGSAGKAA